MRILLVDDNQDLTSTLKKILLKSNYMVDITISGEEALLLLKKIDFDLLILDITLPQCSGLVVCSQIRHKHNTIPIIMLTGRSSPKDRINGLNCGADDYLTKPFTIEELLLRIRNLLRHSKSPKQQILTIGNIDFNIFSREFLINKKLLNLSAREFGVLEYLFHNCGRTISREELLEHVWGNYEENVFTNTVDVHIRYLRKKVGNELISTIRGFGYRINR